MKPEGSVLDLKIKINLKILFYVFYLSNVGKPEITTITSSKLMKSEGSVQDLKNK